MKKLSALDKSYQRGYDDGYYGRSYRNNVVVVDEESQDLSEQYDSGYTDGCADKTYNERGQ